MKFKYTHLLIQVHFLEYRCHELFYQVKYSYSLKLRLKKDLLSFFGDSSFLGITHCNRRRPAKIDCQDNSCEQLVVTNLIDWTNEGNFVVNIKQLAECLKESENRKQMEECTPNLCAYKF